MRYTKLSHRSASLLIEVGKSQDVSQIAQISDSGVAVNLAALGLADSSAPALSFSILGDGEGA